MTTPPVQRLTTAVIEELRAKAAGIPAGGPPVVQRAHQRAVGAVELVETAVRLDPTLPEKDRCQRDLDLIAEILRQLKPLARQAIAHLERQRLIAAGAGEREIGRLGRTNPAAPAELDAMSERCADIACRVSASAWPDWNTPERARERSRNLLPSSGKLEEIAERLRYVIEESLSLAHPDPEAVLLAELADQITAAAKRIDEREQ